MTMELTALNEISVNNSMGFIYITRIQQLTTYTLQLILLTTEYKREWTDIMSSISNRNTNHHTIPLEAMMAARKRFHMYYGSKNDETKFGITHHDLLLHMPTLSESTVEYFTQIKANVTQILTQINICLLYTSPSPRDKRQSRMPSSA